MNVIFCLSYDLSKELFIAFKVDNISTKNASLSRTSSWRYLFPPKVYSRVVINYLWHGVIHWITVTSYENISSTALTDSPSPNNFQFFMLYSHLCLCLHLFQVHKIFTAPCLARGSWDTWPCHLNLRVFPMVRRSSSFSIASWMLLWTSPLATWSLKWYSKAFNSIAS